MIAKKFNFNGSNIAYYDNEKKAELTVFFVHGNSLSSNSFRYQFNSSALSNYRLISLDLPGHGNSDYFPHYSLSLLSEVLKKIVESANVENYALIGHSLGGHVVLQSLSRLAPIGVAIFGTPPLQKPYDIETFNNNATVENLFKEKLEISVKDYLQGFYSSCEPQTEDIIDFMQTDSRFRSEIQKVIPDGGYESETDTVSRITYPLLVLHGENDCLFPLSYLEKVLNKKGLWKQKVHVIKGGHNFFIENFETVNNLLGEFLLSVSVVESEVI